MKLYLGLDVGSVTTKFVVLNGDGEMADSLYAPTGGQPVAAVQHGLKYLAERLPECAEICGVAVTGSARYLAGAVIGADIVKNEITCQAAAAVSLMPGVQTVIEIGGQDSKMILIRGGLVTDFGMNAVCAAGTGSFLDHQAARLGMSIDELSRRALEAEYPVNINGRCTVFAESDMVHRQQMGHRTEDIIYGLCRALVRNYLSGVGAGKEIKPPFVFQGGVALNAGMVRALGEELEQEIHVPPDCGVTGAMGAALIAREALAGGDDGSRFKGFGVSEVDFRTSSYDCRDCPAACEIIEVAVGGEVMARWGGRCEKWEASLVNGA